MPITRVTADNDGTIYATTSDGDLLWFKDLARDGTPRWENGGVAQVIGDGWGDFQHVFCGGDGILYAVDQAGALNYYRDLARDGTANWANGGAGQPIAQGWNAYSKVTSGGNGVIYAVDGVGNLVLHKDLARNGTASWAPHSGTTIASGWGDYKQVIGGGDGVLYAIDGDGKLLFFKDLAQDGTVHWANGGAGQAIGDDWGNFVSVFSGGDGILYAITADGFILYYHDLARNGTANWALGGAPATLGSGWMPVAATPVTIEGYATPLSVAPGDTVHFMVSSESPYEVTYLRLKQQPNGEVGQEVLGPFVEPAGKQTVPDNAWEGCSWHSSFSLQVPDSWGSGMYTASCTTGDGETSYILFVVNPTAPSGPIAVLANTLTWDAYNDWGGRSKYTAPPGALLSFERPNPYVTPADNGTIDHLARAELWILGWLEDEGYAFDVYADTELDSGPILDGYKALILSTHPEYWTSAMMDRLVAFIEGGGSVLYLGGNGLFEQVELVDNGKAIQILGGDPNALRDTFYFRNLVPPRPERALLGVGYRYDNFLTFAPYEVLAANHRFFTGTGVSDGDLIGATGRNGGGASGWEMDTSLEGDAPAGVVVSANGADDRGSAPAGTVVLARGTNPGFGADMTCYETGAGGVVFSVGSISFGGSMVDDASLQQIVRNVLDETIA